MGVVQMVWICWRVVAMRVAVGQVAGIRRVVCRLWRVMTPGMCHRFGRSVLGFARVRGWCLGRKSFLEPVHQGVGEGDPTSGKRPKNNTSSPLW